MGSVFAQWDGRIPGRELDGAIHGETCGALWARPREDRGGCGVGVGSLAFTVLFSDLEEVNLIRRHLQDIRDQVCSVLPFFVDSFFL